MKKAVGDDDDGGGGGDVPRVSGCSRQPQATDWKKVSNFKKKNTVFWKLGREQLRL